LTSQKFIIIFINYACDKQEIESRTPIPSIDLEVFTF